MRIPIIGKSRLGARRLMKRFISGTVILFYHRVAELPSDPQLLCVTPQHFSEHLEILKKFGRPMGVRQLILALQNGNIPDRTLVLTFDDGYADNLYNAKPLLEHYDIPATVFVTTGYLGHKREFWWDDLERVLLQPGTLPASLSLNVNGSTLAFELGDAATLRNENYQVHRRWHVEKREDPSPRHYLYRRLCQLLYPLSETQRRPVLDELLAWAGAQSVTRPAHRPLSPDEVLQLAAGGLLEVGAHGVTHSVLSKLPAEEQWAEIKGSRTRLEEIVNGPINGFAYPYGTRSDYTVETAAMVQTAGFKLACSNFPGFVWRGSNRFQLPRLLIRDWDGEEFARQVGTWFRD
ncbi:MAG: polysaccharide deacetylase family protein [Candidatus Binatia bacterium]